jgi:hypothetical protein
MYTARNKQLITFIVINSGSPCIKDKYLITLRTSFLLNSVEPLNMVLINIKEGISNDT